MPGRLTACASMALAVATAVLSARPGAQEAARARLEDMARRATERIRVLQREADALAVRERTLLGDLRRLEVDRQLKTEELAKVDSELQATAQALAETSARVEALDRAVVEQRPAVRARLVELYKLGRPAYARLLFGVDDVRAIRWAYRTVTTMADADHRRMTEHLQTLASLRASRAALEGRRHDMATLQADARRARQALDRAIAAQTAVIAAIDAERDLTARLVGELQVAQQRLQASLASLSGTGLPAELPVALPLRPFRGELDWPVSGRLISRFGPQPQTRFGTTIIRNGVEIATEEGRPVLAVHAGQVAFADAFTGFGRLVILDHGSQSYSLYGYLTTLDVARGDYIERRQVVGSSGRAPTGEAAVYFELRIDGAPVDPLQWLRRP